MLPHRLGAPEPTLAGFPTTGSGCGPINPSKVQTTPLHPTPGLAAAGLEGVAVSLIGDSLAESTWKTYKAAQVAFQTFCSSLLVPSLPEDEHILLLYVAHLSQKVCHGISPHVKAQELTLALELDPYYFFQFSNAFFGNLLCVNVLHVTSSLLFN